MHVKINRENAGLIGLMTLAFLARFLWLWEYPFTFDELSAWRRTQVSDFYYLIEQGVKPDGHPALLQFFLYHWFAWAQQEEWLVRLPFVLMALGGIYYAFLLAKHIFSYPTAILTLAFLAVHQFFIFYSQLARPYATGLLFTMGFAYHYMRISERPNKIDVLFSILFLTLSAYNHYMNLLTVVIFGIVFFPLKRYRWTLAVAGISVLLFLPHLPITLNQLSLGGLEWLGKPPLSFLGSFLAYLLHFSWIQACLVLLIIFLPLLRKAYVWKPIVSKLLLTFGLTYGIIHAYSVLRAPILQFSSLVFVTPFLVMSSFSLWKDKKYLWLSIILLVAWGLFTLEFERKHRFMMEHQMFSEFTKHVSVERSAHPLPVLWNSNPDYLGFYQRKYHKEFPIFCTYNQPFSDFKLLLDSLSSLHDTLVAGCLDPHQLAYVMRYFPYVQRHEKGFTYDFWVLSKQADSLINRFQRVYGGLTKPQEIKSNEEFYNLYQNKASSVEPYAIVTAAWEAEEGTSAMIVFQVKHGEKMLHYEALPLEKRGSYGVRWQEFPNDAEFAIYLWNPQKELCKLKAFSLNILEANPYIYGFFVPIK